YISCKTTISGNMSRVVMHSMPFTLALLACSQAMMAPVLVKKQGSGPEHSYSALGLMVVVHLLAACADEARKHTSNDSHGHALPVVVPRLGGLGAAIPDMPVPDAL